MNSFGDKNLDRTSGAGSDIPVTEGNEGPTETTIDFAIVDGEGGTTGGRGSASEKPLMVSIQGRGFCLPKTSDNGIVFDITNVTCSCLLKALARETCVDPVNWETVFSGKWRSFRADLCLEASGGQWSGKNFVVFSSEELPGDVVRRIIAKANDVCAGRAGSFDVKVEVKI